MTRRFYSSTLIQPPRTEICGTEAHHMLHVLRLEVGDRVTLFDGSGVEYTARIEHISRQKVQCTIEDQQAIDRELGVELHLAVALPKGDRSRWLVEKAVELGVRRLVPLECERSIVRIRPASLSRLKKAVIEASKQCGRNRLMELSSPVSFSEWFHEEQGDGLRLLAHPGQTARPLQSIDACHQGDTVRIAIGPEGGFSESEVRAAATQDWKVVTLGNRLLRVETSALAAVAAIGLWAHTAE
jgi:16S rRNA (uracil1498-N3)-methyltransferase